MTPENKYVTSIIARSILDVSFIAKLEKGQRSVLSTMSQDLQRDIQAQLHNIRCFSAFIAKVHHNFLWIDFPLTRQLLAGCRMDIAVFTAYLKEYQGNRRRSREEKIRSFIFFLQKWLRRDKTRVAEIASNLVRHENAIYTARIEGWLNPKAVAETSEIPSITGLIKIIPLSVSPGQMQIDSFSIRRIRLWKEKRWFCYWFPPGCQIPRIFEISPEMRTLLRRIDGKNKTDVIMKGTRSARSCERMMTDLKKMGIVYTKLQSA